MLIKVKRYLSTLHRQGKTFGYGFMFQCFFRRLISFKLYEAYVYKYLTRYFKTTIQKFKMQSQTRKLNDDGNGTFHIWTLWWQGEESAPDIVKKCINSQKNNLLFPGIQYHVLTGDNWKEFIELPDYILDKVGDGRISLAHFSDIIRAELIRKYGGIWIDATVLCTKAVDLREYSNPFFTLKVHEQSEFYTMRRWTGFFIGDEKNSLLFDFMSECFRYYWKKEGNLVVYLLIDYLIAIAYEQFEVVKQKVDQIPVTNKELWSLLRKMNTPYDSDEWNKITESTGFFKLSYKDEFNGGPLVEKTDDGNLTYWGFIKGSFGDI